MDFNEQPPVAKTGFAPIAKARDLYERYGDWSKKVVGAIMDQGLFAGSNFLLNILLIRWLEPVQYGAFVTAYAIFLMLGTLHTGMFTEPMLVFGAGKYSKWFRRYLGFLFYGHVFVTALFSLALVGVALFFQSTEQAELAAAFYGVAIATPFILLTWIFRRAFYVVSSPHLAAIGGFIYFALMIGGIYFLNVYNYLTPFTALIAMAISAGLSGLYLLVMLKPRYTEPAKELPWKKVLKDHWVYGRWSTPSTFLIWLPHNIYFAFLPSLVGLTGNANLRATLNLVTPILQANAALSILLTPNFVRALKKNGLEGMGRQVDFARMLMIGGTLTYMVLLVLFGKDMINLIYNGRYQDFVTPTILILISLNPLFVGVGDVMAGGLRSIGRVDTIFWANVVAGVLALTVGLFLMATAGVIGALIGTAISSFGFVVTIYWHYRRNYKKYKADPSLITTLQMEDE